MDLSGVGNMVGSLFGGIASGGFGAALGGVFGLGKQWLDNRQAIAMRQIDVSEAALNRSHDLALMDKEIDKAVIQVEGERSIADTNAMAQVNLSQDRESDSLKPALAKSYKWVNSLVAVILSIPILISKIIRPGLTIYLMVLTSRLMKELLLKIGAEIFTSQEALIILHNCTNTILELTALAVAFWFVARPNNYMKK